MQQEYGAISPAALTEMALFKTTFVWTSQGPQPCYCSIFFALLLFILFPFRASPSLSKWLPQIGLLRNKGDGWKKKKNHFSKDDGGILSCNLYIILYKFCHATKCKTTFGCNQNLLKRSTAVNYVTHGLLIIQRMCLGRIVRSCFLRSEITACKKTKWFKNSKHNTAWSLKKFHLAECANSWPQSTL